MENLTGAPGPKPEDKKGQEDIDTGANAADGAEEVKKEAEEAAKQEA